MTIQQIKTKIDGLEKQWREQVDVLSIPDLIVVANDWYASEIGKLADQLKKKLAVYE